MGAGGNREAKTMRSTRISDGQEFRRNLQEHSGEEWGHFDALAQSTGILAGPDGERSRGIYCESCGFGFRWDFGDFPVREGRTSLANDFNDEAHRRDCPHWDSYVNHPEAFLHCRGDRPAAGQAGSAAAREHRCDRCGATASVTFRCLGRRVCFACLNDVANLTGGYPGLQALMSVKESPERDEGEPAPRGKRTRGRCHTCKASGTLITVRNVSFCRPCAVGEVERLLGV
jgi:hypothetical protein